MIPPNRHRVRGVRWQLSRAWPRDPDQIALELAGPAGGSLVGRWFTDLDQAVEELRRTPGSRSGDDPRLVLHPGGADRKLPWLAELVSDGARLVAHRPGRRAVVRLPNGRYVKVTRAGRAPELARRHVLLDTALDGAARLPSPRLLDEQRVELAELPGETPMRWSARRDGGWDRAWERVGRCLARLAGSPAQPGLALHDAGAEAAVTLMWVERAVNAGRLPAAELDAALQPLCDAAPTTRGLAHRDLHDGQLLFTEDGLGLLDPDTVAAAEPALDLANVLVHLELRSGQGLLAEDQQRRATDAVLRGAAPGRDTLDRLPAYADACRLRLAGVYAFRPRWHGLARAWYAEVLRERRVGSAAGS